MGFRVYKNNKTKQKQTKQNKNKLDKNKLDKTKKTVKTQREVECTPQVNLQVAPENSWFLMEACDDDGDDEYFFK